VGLDLEKTWKAGIVVLRTRATDRRTAREDGGPVYEHRTGRSASMRGQLVTHFIFKPSCRFLDDTPVETLEW
jgi:hypothetical protein